MSSRNIIKLLIAISGGWVLLCAAIIGVFVYAEMHKPQWQKDSEQAADKLESDPKSAIELYQKAIVEAKDDNVAIASRLDLMESAGNVLNSERQSVEAKRLFHEAVGIAQRSGLLERQSDFLILEASAWHQAYKDGNAEMPDDAMVKTALALRSDKEELPNDSVQLAHMVLGEIAFDHEQYDRATAFCKKALSEASALKDGVGKREARLGLIAIAIIQKDYRQCNGIFLDGVDDKDGDATVFRTDYLALMRDAEKVDSEEENIEDNLVSLLDKRKFADLDRFFSADLKKPDESVSGLLFADIHLNCISDIFEDGEAYKKTIAAAEEWNERCPDSQAAKLILADLLINHTGAIEKDSESETPEVAAIFGRAKQILESEKIRTASWYRCYQRIAKRFHYDQVNFDKITAEGQNKYPKYKRLVFIKAATMLPDQQATEADLDKYLASECEKLPEEERDVLYAQAVMYFERYDTTDVLANTNLSWDRTKLGLQKLIAKNENWLYGKAFLSTAATEVKDSKTAESAF